MNIQLLNLRQLFRNSVGLRTLKKVQKDKFRKYNSGISWIHKEKVKVEDEKITIVMSTGVKLKTVNLNQRCSY